MENNHTLQIDPHLQQHHQKFITQKANEWRDEMRKKGIHTPEELEKHLKEADDLMTPEEIGKTL